MAPEVMLGDPFNEKADVYSFGIVLWEMLTRSEPFSHHSDFDAFVEAVCVNNERPPMPEECLSGLRKLITSCWAGNPSVRPSFPVIVDALENIIIDCALEDDVARSIWKNYFFRKENVLWIEEFVPVVAQFMGIPLPNPNKNETLFFKEIDKLRDTIPWKCLAAVLTDKKEHELIVNIEKFGQVLNWFGPFREPDGQIRFLERIKDTLACPWFFGPIEYEPAVNQLSDKEPGTFLIRFSSKENPGCFTISKVNQNSKIIHQRILPKPGGQYTIANGKSYPSLFDLVSSAKEEQKLLKACPGFPYSSVFQQKVAARLYECEDD
jgi:serine/threonine protein kinase